MKKQTFTIIRGLPGSGKSTLAKSLAEQNNLKHFEADMYFEDKDGTYFFNPNLLPNAHGWCQTQVDTHLALGYSVVVSNTFTTQKEIDPYLSMAKKHGVKANIILCQSNYGSIHDVPEKSMIAMKNRFIYDIRTSAP